MIAICEASSNSDTDSESPEITALLKDWSEGDEEALNEIMVLVYNRLYKVARRRLRGEDPGHTLTPTALIHEVFLRLKTEKKLEWHNRAQFFWYAGELFRRILVEHARAKAAAKRGSGERNLELDLAASIAVRPGLDLSTILSLDKALDKLEKLDRRRSLLVKLRFFAGLSLDEIAEILQVSSRTLKRDWRAVRCWLAREMELSGP